MDDDLAKSTHIRAVGTRWRSMVLWIGRSGRQVIDGICEVHIWVDDVGASSRHWLFNITGHNQIWSSLILGQKVRVDTENKSIVVDRNKRKDHGCGRANGDNETDYDQLRER